MSDQRREVIGLVMRLIDYGKGHDDPAFDGKTLGQIADAIIVLVAAIPKPEREAEPLTDEERTLLLTPCPCGHTINEHGSLVPCWVCAEDDESECSTDFEALLCERLAVIVTRRVEAAA